MCLALWQVRLMEGELGRELRVVLRQRQSLSWLRRTESANAY